MVSKIIDATQARVGNNIMVDGTPCIVKSIDVSKTGKHGHSKARIEAIGIANGQKKVFVVPGHDKLEIPFVDKRRAQVLSIEGDKVTVMDSENFESFEIPINDEIKKEIEENSNIEYWDVEGEKIVRRKV
ncbi:MAG: translation initiation factor IF-5A [Candidatus Pacearchaeota archaeon]